MSQNEKYRQLALFSVIVAEVVVTPAACGGLAYLLTDGFPARIGISLIAVFVGLAVAFYRISLMFKRQKRNEAEGK
ncbi:hypothetical protein EB061_05790 [bacterium]|jgi:hypothetical protein|nr:hypothetical protein [bacterium]